MHIITTQKSFIHRSLSLFCTVIFVGSTLIGCTQHALRGVGYQAPVSKEERFPIVVKGGKAYTQKCGYWPKDLSGDFYNRPHPNFGCSTQNNLAAMLENPNDVNQVRKPLPSNGARRAVAIEKFYTGSGSSSGGGASSSGGSSSGSSSGTTN